MAAQWAPGPLQSKVKIRVFLLQEVLFALVVHSVGVSDFEHYTAQAQQDLLGLIYTVRFWSRATSARQAYDMTYDCRSVLKHVLKCCDIFFDVQNNRKSCRRPVVSRCRMRQKSYLVNWPLNSGATNKAVFILGR